MTKAEEYVNSNGFCSFYNDIEPYEANEEIAKLKEDVEYWKTNIII